MRERKALFLLDLNLEKLRSGVATDHHVELKSEASFEVKQELENKQILLLSFEPWIKHT